MLPYAAFHLGLHSLPKYLLTGIAESISLSPTGLAFPILGFGVVFFIFIQM